MTLTFICTGTVITEMYTLSLHDALPILLNDKGAIVLAGGIDVSKGASGTNDGTIQFGRARACTRATKPARDTTGKLITKTTGTSGAQNISLTGNVSGTAGTKAADTGNAM